MAIIPEDNLALSEAVEFEDEPSLTWYIDPESRTIAGYCDGLVAVQQAVEIILNTIRYEWPIYLMSSGIEYDNLIGNNPGYVAIELQRRIIDALTMDDRINGISQYSYTSEDDVLSASFVVNTVYGDIDTALEVNV